MSTALSQSLHNILLAIDPGKRPAGEASFPRGCGGPELRVSSGESIDDWFHRVVETRLNGDLQAAAIEDNLAMFLQFGWEARRFRYLHCQAIAVIGGTLDDAYLRSDGIDLRYLRLEYESGPFMLGALFSHPVVHIHSQPREAPRFALDSTDGETVLLDFLDFLYRNFCHDAWSRWATVACEASADPETAVHFEAIRTFFLEEEGPGKRARLAEVIARCRDWLPRVKRCLRAAKKEMPMNLTVEPGDLTLFSYHL